MLYSPAMISIYFQQLSEKLCVFICQAFHVLFIGGWGRGILGHTQQERTEAAKQTTNLFGNLRIQIMKIQIQKETEMCSDAEGSRRRQSL